jgi:hypothetical protein
MLSQGGRLSCACPYPMKHALIIESIGDDIADMAKHLRAAAERSVPGMGRYFGLGFLMPWVAEIKGVNGEGKLRRRFLQAQKDYSLANHDGSRGIRLVFLLDEGPIYEVKPGMAWRRSARYFCRLGQGGQEEHLTYDQVISEIQS